ncbi:MAG: sulfate adenylyltransferase [Candidatus Bathyarchaeota archaeon]
MVSEPYGGKLVSKVLIGETRCRIIEEAHEMPRLSLNNSTKLDIEKIAIGAFSPLKGFMGRDDYEAVVYKGKLSNGLCWTIPIVLSPNNEENKIIVKKLKEGDDIALIHDKKPIAILHLEEKFNYDKKELARHVYGTLDLKHPDVAKLHNNLSNILLAGEIDYIQDLKTHLAIPELTPLETRQIFKRRKWKTIAAYQTRNPPHVAHEYLQRCTLEIVNGIFIHPAVGELKKGDFPPEAIIETYQFLLDNYYPKDRVVLSPLSIAMRYAGPKGAIFLAIVRKNYGCTHFIVGRDIAGVENYYDPYGAHKAFKDLDLGIEPILFKESFYCRSCSNIVTEKTCRHNVKDHIKISMTKIREMIKNGVNPPAEVMHPEITKILMKYGSKIDSP